MSPLILPIEQLVSSYRAGRSLALLLDFDGTLSPIVDTPHLAAFVPGARHALRSLAALPRVYVGFISGRAIGDLKQMVQMPSAWLVGTNGLEMEYGGKRIRHGDTATVRDLLSRIASRLRSLSLEFPGSWLEMKPLGLTLHYRHIAIESAPEFLATVRRILRDFVDSVVVALGPAAVEIIPAVGLTKGTAVQELCQQTHALTIPVYAGDSENDLAAFEATDSLGGITIGVGPRADYPVNLRVDGPSELIAWLNDLLQGLNC